MDTQTILSDLIGRFQSNQLAVGRAKGTTERYKYTFRLFGRFLEETGTTQTAECLKTATMDQFATWLRDTPINEQRHTTKRAESGIHAHLCDMRAFYPLAVKAGADSEGSLLPDAEGSQAVVQNSGRFRDAEGLAEQIPVWYFESSHPQPDTVTERRLSQSHPATH